MKLYSMWVFWNVLCNVTYVQQEHNRSHFCTPPLLHCQSQCQGMVHTATEGIYSQVCTYRCSRHDGIPNHIAAHTVKKDNNYYRLLFHYMMCLIKTDHCHILNNLNKCGTVSIIFGTYNCQRVSNLGACNSRNLIIQGTSLGHFHGNHW